MNPQAFLASVAITLGVAFGAHWDDETFLGRGPMVNAGIAVPLGRHLAAEGEIQWASHHRNSGYLAADGAVQSATGRLALKFRDPGAKVRPVVTAGVTRLRSTGHFTHTSLIQGPDGRPVSGPLQRTDWETSLGAWEFGTGAEINVGSHLMVRPEARWTLTTSDRSFTPVSLESPLFVIRGGVTMAWRR